MKLDKKFVGQITKVKDGSIVGEDEYVVFLAKDTAFASILPTYRLPVSNLDVMKSRLLQ